MNKDSATQSEDHLADQAGQGGALQRYSYNLARLSAFCIPLKLAAALVFLIPLVSIWLYQNAGRIRSVINKPQHSHIRPLLTFLIVAFYTSLFGIDLKSSFSGLPSVLFFSFIPFAVADALNRNTNKIIELIIALLAGQSLAGLHSVFELFVPGQVFLGKVTESGQIALTMMLAVGMAYYLPRDRSQPLKFKRLTVASVIILAATLLINLKRGPWMGVIVGLAIFLNAFSRRFLVPFVSVVVSIFILVAPVRERLLSSYDDFSISGGREVIWDIGSELSLRYPLGIGFDNSYLLRKFSTEIPEKLKHFHNNLLNVLVETGWLGLFIYIWWITVIIRSCWRKTHDRGQQILLRSFGCAVISWQIAGLVEYNFGDSEVFMTVMMVLGLLSAINSKQTAA